MYENDDNLNYFCFRLVPMTKTKTILGISFAAVMAVSLMYMPTALASGHGFSVVKAVADKDKKNYDVVFVLSEEPPAAFWGVAIPTKGGFLGVTLHDPIHDSEGDPGLHTHFVTVATDTVECGVGSVVVTSASFEEVGTAELVGNAVIVEDVPKKIGKKLKTDEAFSFGISLGLTGKVCLNP